MKIFNKSWFESMTNRKYKPVIYSHKPSGNLCFRSLKRFTYIVSNFFVHKCSKVKRNSGFKVCTSNGFATEPIQSKNIYKQKTCFYRNLLKWL